MICLYVWFAATVWGGGVRVAESQSRDGVEGATRVEEESGLANAELIPCCHQDRDSSSAHPGVWPEYNSFPQVEVLGEDMCLHRCAWYGSGQNWAKKSLQRRLIERILDRGF